MKMNRRTFFKGVTAMLSACLVPLPGRARDRQAIRELARSAKETQAVLLASQANNFSSRPLGRPYLIVSPREMDAAKRALERMNREGG